MKETYLKLKKTLTDDVNLIAVSKKQPLSKIEEAISLGIKDFGENRVQEAYEHWGDYEGDDVILHLIGPLQSNKVSQAVALFDVIQTVDREKIAKALVKEMKKQNRQLYCFIQVNCGDEEQKSGVSFGELRRFYHFCVEECGLNIVGLMCIPPKGEKPDPYFSKMLQYKKMLGLDHLSMGMSNDYKHAIDYGATYVRLGTALFGARAEG